MADDSSEPDTHLRSLCGRADLVRALAFDDPELLAGVAARLGFEPRPTPAVRRSTRQAPIPPGADAGDAPGLQREPRILEHPLAPARFWQPVVREDVQVVPPPALEDGPLELPEWSSRPPELARAQTLAQWRELLPRLRRALAEQAETCALDLPAIVRRLGRGESLHRLPHRRRPRWGLSLHIIEDRSDHLAPYWDDQEQVRQDLARLFPHYTVEHALWYEGLEAPVWADDVHARRPYRLPAPGSLVLALGDLGCLLHGGTAERRRWLALGQRLAADGCRTLALTPSPRCPRALQRYWRLLAWERLPPQTDDAARAHTVRRLLALAASTLRLEPGLLRELRLLIGADAGSEAELWQDPSVIGRSAVAATLSPEQAEQRRADFCAEPASIQSRALALQRAWRAGLPPELWFAEVQTLPSQQRARLVGAADRRQSLDFVAALGRQAAGVRGAVPVPGAIPWFRDVAAWLPEGYLDDPQLGAYFYRIWAEILRRDPQQQPPIDLRPDRLPVEQPARRVALSQRGSGLQALFANEGVGIASHLATVNSANGLIRVEVAGHPQDSVAFWEAGMPPPWADAWDWDEQGAWVEFSVENSDGERITQRMRWIQPGSFQMGSPVDEPERFSDEGPRHQVQINEGFWLFDTACTQRLWEAVMGENPSRFKGPNRPVEQVSWEDAQRFMERLNALHPGLALALPSEAQWEYACRAGTQTAFSFGANVTPEQVNYNGEYPYANGAKGEYPGETVAVGSLPANAWGLYEMQGNVWEWVQDPWHGTYQDARADASAWESGDAGAGRVVRGGSWVSGARSCRCAGRDGVVPDYRNNYLGFRCARVQGRELGQAGSGASGPGVARPAERIRRVTGMLVG